jgi:hypothetical protein
VEEEHGPDSVSVEEEWGVDVVEEERGTNVEEVRGNGIMEE